MRKVSYLARARRSLESTRVPSISEDGGTELRNQAALRLEADELLFLLGTFLPLRRASERPMAIACLRLFTVFPLRPDFNLPRLNSCISRLTSLPALGLYLRRELDFFLPRDEELRRLLLPLWLRDLELLDLELLLAGIDGTCLL